MWKYQVILLDFDGLLVDTEPLHYAAYMQACRERGYPLDWDFARYCTHAHAQSMGCFVGLQKEYPDVFKEGLTQQILYAEKKQIYMQMLRNSPPALMPGAQEFICMLAEQKIKTAVVTNSPKEQIEWVKKALPVLEKIPLWVTREDYKEAKPSPEGYLKAISQLANPDDRIIGFEDSLKGVRALLDAGSEAVFVNSPAHKHREEAVTWGAQHCETLTDWHNKLQ